LIEAVGFLSLQNEYIAATYYYTALNDSEFAFAFSLSDTDRVSDCICLWQRFSTDGSRPPRRSPDDLLGGRLGRSKISKQSCQCM